MKVLISMKKRGNIQGMAKHIANLIGRDDPGFHTRCTEHPWVKEAAASGGYDINALCARVHKIIIGHYPAEDKELKSLDKFSILTGRIVKK